MPTNTRSKTPNLAIQQLKSMNPVSENKQQQATEPARAFVTEDSLRARISLLAWHGMRDFVILPFISATEKKFFA
jgi:hypothetical protein